MAAQGSGGAFEISQRMTAMVGWGATTDFREDWTWDQVGAWARLAPRVLAPSALQGWALHSAAAAAVNAAHTRQARKDCMRPPTPLPPHAPPIFCAQAAETYALDPDMAARLR